MKRPVRNVCRIIGGCLLAALPVCSIGGLVEAEPLPTRVPPGSWAEYSNSALRPALRPNPPWNPCYLFAYSGGAFDPVRSELLVWGGGHGDYPGNEVCRFALGSGTWTCTARSTAYSNQTVDSLPDGTPAARHTYASLAFIPEPGWDGVFAHGGSLWPGGGSTPHTWLWRRPTQAWERLPERPLWGDSEYGRQSLAAVTAYDPVRKRVHVRGRTRTMSFDLASRTWILAGGAEWFEAEASGAYDPERRLLLILGRGRAELWDTRGSTWVRRPLILTGDTAVVSAWGPGLVFEPVGKRYLAWLGGRDLYEINRDTWTVKRLPGAGSDPGPPYPQGTFGRFAYVPKTHGLVVVSDIDRDVFYYQLPGALLPAGTPALGPKPRRRA